MKHARLLNLEDGVLSRQFYDLLHTIKEDSIQIAGNTVGLLAVNNLKSDETLTAGAYRIADLARVGKSERKTALNINITVIRQHFFPLSFVFKDLISSDNRQINAEIEIEMSICEPELFRWNILDDKTEITRSELATFLLKPLGDAVKEYVRKNLEQKLSGSSELRIHLAAEMEREMDDLLSRCGLHIHQVTSAQWIRPGLDEIRENARRRRVELDRKIEDLLFNAETAKLTDSKHVIELKKLRNELEHFRKREDIFNEDELLKREQELLHNYLLAKQKLEADEKMVDLHRRRARLLTEMQRITNEHSRIRALDDAEMERFIRKLNQLNEKDCLLSLHEMEEIRAQLTMKTRDRDDLLNQHKARSEALNKKLEHEKKLLELQQDHEVEKAKLLYEQEIQDLTTDYSIKIEEKILRHHEAYFVPIIEKIVEGVGKKLKTSTIQYVEKPENSVLNSEVTRFCFLALHKGILVLKPGEGPDGLHKPVFYKLPDHMGKLRSITPIVSEGKTFLLLGLQKGLFQFDLQQNSFVKAFQLPDKIADSLKFGFNSATILNDRLYASHSQLGIIQWPLDSRKGDCRRVYPSDDPRANERIRAVNCSSKNREITFIHNDRIVKYYTEDDSKNRITKFLADLTGKSSSSHPDSLKGFAEFGDTLYATSFKGKLICWDTGIDKDRFGRVIRKDAFISSMYGTRIAGKPRLIRSHRHHVGIHGIDANESERVYPAPEHIICDARYAPDYVFALGTKNDEKNFGRFLLIWQSNHSNRPPDYIIDLKNQFNSRAEHLALQLTKKSTPQTERTTE